MNILYCRIGWMSSYRGAADERPLGGGKYNLENIGHEVHNFLGYEGKYYGFVEIGNNGSIHIEKFCGDKKADSVNCILVVWVARKPTGGQFIVGWYENATVYRRLQNVPSEVMDERDLKTHSYYNIFSEQAILLEPQDRHFRVEGMGQSNFWYGNPDLDDQVVDYIHSNGQKYLARIEEIEKNTKTLIGEEKNAIVKVRVNQDIFRSRLISKYHGKCCLCGVDNESLLNASHIKPWSESDEREKLDSGNGLLLCPNHDKLFDRGYISFDDEGNILISDRLTETNKIFMNVDKRMSVLVTEDNKEYFRYHRKYCFN